MRLALAASCSALLFATSVSAAPVTGAARDALAGSWQAIPGSTKSACGSGDETAVSIVLEFAMTGGTITVDDGNQESSGQDTITAVDDTKDKLTLKLKSGTWTFKHGANGVLVSEKPPEEFNTMAGHSFRLCTKPADRSAIHLTPAQAAGISAAMPNGPTLIDSRAPKGCKATEYQYLNFDVVGPTGFQLHRWNSYAVGEKLADGGKLNFKVDEITDFNIEQADVIPGGYRFKVTELIPPNGSRGDTTTITVNIKGKTATIPEWKRTYLLCTNATP